MREEGSPSWGGEIHSCTEVGWFEALAFGAGYELPRTPSVRRRLFTMDYTYKYLGKKKALAETMTCRRIARRR